MSKEIEEEVAKENVEIIEQKIEEVKEEIQETPKEDKDKQWQDNLTLTLETLTEEIKGLRETKGASAEIAALQQQVNRLATALETYTPPKISSEGSPKQEPEKEEGQPSPETKMEISSETGALASPKEPETVKAPVRKNQRGWI